MVELCLPQGISLRPIHDVDLDQVMEIEQRVYPFPWSRENFESCLKPNYECWMLLCDNNPIGHAVLSVAAGESHLLNISVDTSSQRQGLGRKLLRCMLVKAKQRKASVTFLEVRISNTKALDLYLSEGFNEVGLRKNYYPAGKQREDAMVLAINL